MSDPSTTLQEQSKPVAVIPLIAAGLFAAPGILGLLVLALIFVSWVVSGFQFPPEDEHFSIVFGTLAMLIIIGSALIVGIALRYTNWRMAPALSLGISVVVLSSVLASTAMFQSLFDPTDFASWNLLLLFGVAGLVVGALPPLLYWRKGRRLGSSR